VIVAVVVLVVVLVTGGSSSSGNYPSSSSAAGTAYFRDISNADLAALKKLACPGTRITLKQPELDAVTSAQATGDPVESGSTATQNGHLEANDGTSADVVVHLKKVSGGWCLERTEAS
jgi:hypothetical protein